MTPSTQHATAPKPSQSLCERFMLLPEVRSGGMGEVQKALDLQTSQFVAIKRMKSSGDQLRSKTSFQREVEALQRLDHPNIVKLIQVDQDENGRWFLAMEWIERNLETYVLEKGPMSWASFVEGMGRPLLSAVEYAQVSRNLVHRDLNPRNILVTDRGVPKITDYGISKVLDDRDAWTPVAGGTFVDARTPGFSPKEVDDRVHSRRRDCFSLAAIAVFCLVGRRLDGDEDLGVALQEAPLPDAVRRVVERALSDDPRQRPLDARAMRTEFEQIEAARAQADEAALPCYLDLTRGVEDRIREQLDLSSREDIERFVLDELAETNAVSYQRLPDGTTNRDRLDIIGVSWRFRAVIGGRAGERLEIIGAYDLEAARAGKLRDEAYRTPIQFTFGRPIDAPTAADALQELQRGVGRHEEQRAAARRTLDSERIFRAWKGYLRDRLHLETNRANAIHYKSRRINKNQVTLNADIAPSADVIGEDRFVRVGGRHVFGRISQVVLDQVVLEITKGDPELLPHRGELLLNTNAAERAIAYQSSAVDAVLYDRITNPRLKAILLDPSCARSPEPVSDDQVQRSTLKGEKRSVLRKALGTTEILAIEGPPGTSKTDVISEICVNWLARNPGHRILLSSQTHTALDEAIERIATLKADGAEAIVRIGRSDDPRIGEVSKPLMLEQKVERWAEQVRHTAESNMAAWAEERGVDRALVSLGMRVERLVQLLRQLADVEERIATEEAEANAAEDRLEEIDTSPDEVEELGLTTIEIGDELALLKATRRQIRQQVRSVRAELASSPDLGPQLAEVTDVFELEEWQGVYLNGDEAVRECQQRLSLLESWLLRVGRTGDFNAAVLSDAKIIAATCVGIAGVKGIEAVEYDLCIVDEASKATATEILIPMSRSKRWIIVGDAKQLPPFFEEFGENLLSEYDEKKEIRPTILDRMIDKEAGLPGECRAEMKVQHRMIKPIGDLVSACFYDRTLESPIESHNLRLHPDVPAAVTWYTTTRERRHEEQPVGKTFQNDLEVEWTKRVLHNLQGAAQRQSTQMRVALISGYTAQVKRLATMAERNASEWPNLKVVCNSVHAFQGKHADVCVYSVVRSNRKRQLGFLREKPLLNVALSRARSGLILIGDHHFCLTAKGENPFKPVIEWVENHPDTCHLGPLIL